jgi:hypothetical protein
MPLARQDEKGPLMGKVTLNPAFSWTCEDCGRDQFTRGIAVEMSEEGRAELNEENGLGPEPDGVWMMMPEQVTCEHCGAMFDTEHYGE